MTPTERLTALKAELAATESARAEVLAARAIDAEIAATELALAAAKRIAELEASHGPLNEAFSLLTTPVGIVAIGKPKAAVYRAYIDTDGHAAPVIDQFLRQCILPQTEAAKLDFARIIEEMPGVLWAAENVACALARRGLEIVSKK